MSRSSRGGGGGGGRGSGGYRNPCITMHQPWASLLVHGIKRIEGRSWPAPLTGRLWIHAAGKVPDPATIRAMEDFYREIYAVNGITDLKFPGHYPISRLLGCVDVVGCVKCEELVCWEEVPESVRLEGQTDFCWLCEQPQKLLVPFEMRGYQRVYNLERKIFEAAVRGLCSVKGPLPVKFPLPDPQNPYSLKPGSLASYHSASKSLKLEEPPSLTAAIAGARAAATQFSNKGPNRNTIAVQKNSVQREATSFGENKTSTSVVTKENRRLPDELIGRHDSSEQLDATQHAENHEIGNYNIQHQENNKGDKSQLGASSQVTFTFPLLLFQINAFLGGLSFPMIIKIHV